MATDLNSLLVQRFLEGEKLRQGQISAGEQILPAAAGVEKANVETLGPLNLRNAVAGSNLQNTQQQLAQRFLSGGVSAPLDPGARETLESGRRDQLQAIQGIPGGDSGLRRQLTAGVDQAHVQARAGLVNSANDRLFQRLSSNLNPGAQTVPTPQLAAATNISAGGDAALNQGATIQQRMLELAVQQQQENDRNLFAAISTIGQVLPSVLDILF